MLRGLLLLPLSLLGCASPPPARAATDAPSPPEVDAAMHHWSTAPQPPAARTLSAAAAPSQAFRIAAPTERSRRRSGRRVDVELHRATLPDALQLLANEARINLVLAEGISGEVSLSLRQVDPLEALETLASSRNLTLDHQGAITVIRKHLPAIERSFFMSPRLFLLSLPGALLVFSAFPACSNDGGVPVPAVSRDGFIQDMARQVCQRREQCQCSTLNVTPAPVVGAACEASVQNELRAMLPEAAGLTFDESCAALFLDEFSRQPACQQSVGVLYQAFRCQVGCSLQSGSAREGEPCPAGATTLLSTGCAGQLTCGNNNTCRNYCPATVGERCNYDPQTQTSRSCDASSSCDCSGNNGIDTYYCTCVARAAEGESCTQRGCQGDLLCSCPASNPSCAYNQRVCRGLPAIGERCPETLCRPGAFCNTQPPSPAPPEFFPTCQARRENGSGCNAYEQCLSGFCPDGVCRVIPAAGEPCPGGLCGDGLQCKEGVCQGQPGILCTNL